MRFIGLIGLLALSLFFAVCAMMLALKELTSAGYVFASMIFAIIAFVLVITAEE